MASVWTKYIKYKPQGGKARLCVSQGDYNIYTNGRALSDARTNARTRCSVMYGTPSSCTYNAQAEVNLAKFSISEPGMFGLQPSQRCNFPNFSGSPKMYPGGDASGPSKRIEIPSSSPCPGKEVCVQTKEEEKWSSPSPERTGKPRKSSVTLEYQYRCTPTSLRTRPSGVSCRPPNPSPWQSVKVNTGNTVTIETVNKDYDLDIEYRCCCSCQPIRVAGSVYCPKPKSWNPNPQTVQAVLAALAAGSCAAAIALSAPISVPAATAAGCIVLSTSLLMAPCKTQ